MTGHLFLAPWSEFELLHLYFSENLFDGHGVVLTPQNKKQLEQCWVIVKFGGLREHAVGGRK